ncbi:MAG: hypothetical protein KF726_02585 [Anaerolineae bacterium]|nr:hypothetical protein [Anaerolineae bacterium]
MFKTPHLRIDDANPVFDFELRRIKRLAQPDRLLLYSALAQFLPPLLIVLVYVWQLVVAVYERNMGSPGTNNYGNYGYYYPQYFYVSNFMDFYGMTMQLVVGCVLLSMVISSIYYLAVSVHAINQQLNNGHWDSLRLTPLPDNTIYVAKLTSAEIRAWRVMNVEIGSRLMLILFLLIYVLLPPQSFILGYPLIGQDSYWGSLFASFSYNTFSSLLQIGMLVILALVLLLEPRWRMRTLLGLGLAISARVRNLSLSSIGAVMALFGFYLGLAALLFALLMGFHQLNTTMWLSYFYNGAFDSVTYSRLIYVLQLTAVVVITLAGYLYYGLIRNVSQRSVLRHAFRSE